MQRPPPQHDLQNAVESMARVAMKGTAAEEPAADGAGAQSRCASAGHRRRVVLPGMRSGTITEMCVAPPHAESTRRGRTMYQKEGYTTPSTLLPA